MLADDSHEISSLIFSKIRKDENKENLSSAAVMIGTLRVNPSPFTTNTISFLVNGFTLVGYTANNMDTGANFINEFTTCFCLKNIVRSSYVKNRVSSKY